MRWWLESGWYERDEMEALLLSSGGLVFHYNHTLA
jgi:hypothetical protein